MSINYIKSEIRRLEARLNGEVNPNVRKSLAKEIKTLKGKISLPTQVVKSVIKRSSNQSAEYEKKLQVLHYRLSQAKTRYEQSEAKREILALKERYGKIQVKDAQVTTQMDKRVEPIYRITKSNNFKKLIN